MKLWHFRNDLTAGKLKAFLADIPDETEVYLLNRTDDHLIPRILFLDYNTPEEMKEPGQPGTIGVGFVEEHERQMINRLVEGIAATLKAERMETEE